MSASAVFGGIGLLISGLQYRSTVAAGKAEQEFYNAQARNRRLQGRVEAVEAKEKGNEILRRTKAALASNLAGGYASSVIPTVGSVQTVSRQQVLRPASLDFGITEMDALLAVEQANREAGYLEYRGQMAKAQARTQALAGIASSLVQIGLSGALDFGSGLVGGQSNISNIGAASQINTAGTSGVMSSVARPGQAAFTKSIAGGANPISGNFGSFNTAGGPAFMGI